MLGKTHVNLGFLAAAAANITMPAIPSAAFLLVFNLAPAVVRYLLLGGISFAIYLSPEKGGVFLIPLTIAFGSLCLDLDEPNSILSRLIAPTVIVIRLMLTIASISLIYFGWQLNSTWIMIAGSLVLTASVFKLLPESIMHCAQKLLLIAAGTVLILWQPNSIVFGLGVLYVIMGVLSHRGITHSIEGAVIIIGVMWQITSHLGYSDLLLPFALGYVTHLVADLLTDHGIYLSYFAKIKIGLGLFHTGSIFDKGMGFVAMVVVLGEFFIDLYNVFVA